MKTEKVHDGIRFTLSNENLAARKFWFSSRNRTKKKMMKKYEVLVFNPGGSPREYDILATHFSIEKGAYFFWQDKILLTTTPITLTVIETIQEYKD